MVSLFGANAGSPLFPLEVERRKDDGPTEGRWNGRTDRYPTRARFLSSDGLLLFLLSYFSGAARIFLFFVGARRLDRPTVGVAGMLASQKINGKQEKKKQNVG